MNNCLTITMIFKASSLNYGEGIGNISELKKLSRGNGNVYTYASRQALRYDIVRLGNKMFGWNLECVTKNGTVQFKKDATIEDSQEMDLFGYMKTAGGNASDTRSAAVRLSNAISLESYNSDIELLNNKGLADRIGEYPNLANIEQHLSYYTYTITIDLTKIGKDETVELSNEEKAKRVIELLEIIKILNREIRGREENLSPLFVIGGIYQVNSPFFLGRISLEKTNDKKFNISTEELEDTLKLKIGENTIKEYTSIGVIRNVFANEDALSELVNGKLKDIQQFFEVLEAEVRQYYCN